jgi:hypothetical protein
MYIKELLKHLFKQGIKVFQLIWFKKFKPKQKLINIKLLKLEKRKYSNKTKLECVVIKFKEWKK